ncbi:MAG: hypothetical protein HY882_13120 [Deltaproteobacteria bacterium]|nr:hypothetical protein [Deltaproteobacteria bacterium]
MMSNRYGVLCLFLSFVVLLLAFKNYEAWFQASEGMPRREIAKKAEGRTEVSPVMGSPGGASSREAILEIAEKNIFNPERKEFPILTVNHTKPISRPPILLYGVVVGDDYQTASIVYPGRPLQKGEREIKTLKIGDRIGDYQLTKISPDRITLEAGGDSFEILLYDPKFPKRRVDVKTAAKPAEVTSTHPVPAPPPAPAPAVPKPSAPQVAPRPMEPIKGSAIETPMPKPVTPAPVPDPGLWRGRRSIRPAPPVESGGK